MCNIFCCKKKPDQTPTITLSNPNIFEYELCTINNIDLCGNAPIHNAHTYQYMQELLNNKQIDVNIKNKNGDTPLHTCHSPELAVMLLASGADPDAVNNQNQTPIDTSKDIIQKSIIKQFSITDISFN
jgi:ankyrin repeat protein